MNILSLPVEMLMRIFYFLTQRDKAVIARVCRLWSNCVKCKSIWKNDFIAVGKYDKKKLDWIVQHGVNGYTVRSDFDRKMYRPFIERIRCKDHKSLRQLLLTKRKLHGIKYIQLGCEHIKYRFLHQIFKKMPNLLTVSIKFGIYLWKSLSELKELKKLQKLRMERCCIFTLSFLEFLKTECAKQLRTLELARVTQLNVNVFPEIVRNCEQLENLELFYKLELTYDVFKSTLNNISNSLKNLKFYINNIEEKNILAQYMDTYILEMKWKPYIPYIKVSVIFPNGKSDSINWSRYRI